MEVYGVVVSNYKPVKKMPSSSWNTPWLDGRGSGPQVVDEPHNPKTQSFSGLPPSPFQGYPNSEEKESYIGLKKNTINKPS